MAATSGLAVSGPAGGVSGAACYGQQLGLAKIIGFDMGGTSTDISLIENGSPHLTTEKFEAGWKIAVVCRISAPRALAMELMDGRSIVSPH